MNTNVNNKPCKIKTLANIIAMIEKKNIRISEQPEDWYDIVYSVISIDPKNAKQNLHRIHRFHSNYEFSKTEKFLDEAIENLPEMRPSFSEFKRILSKHGIKVDGEKVEFEPKIKTTNTIISAIEYITKNYQIRFNEISLDFEVFDKNEKLWKMLNDNDLYLDLHSQNIRISHTQLYSILFSSSIEKFDPIKSYFQNLPQWDEKDYIKEFCDYLDIVEMEDFYHQFKKWLVRCVLCATVEGFFNKQALIFVGSQNNGKSTLCRFICPQTLLNYKIENLSTNKDSRISLATNYLCNLDELSELDKKDINALKALFSIDRIKDRLPYGKKAIVLDRKCNFIGSIDRNDFLSDGAGSVRWLCFNLKSINWDYSKNINIDLLYSQAVALSKDHDFNFQMTSKEIQQNEIRNKQFRKFSVEMDLISRFIEPDFTRDPGRFHQTTEILEYFLSRIDGRIRINAVQLGKGLRLMGFESEKHNGVYGYYVKKK